MANKQALPNGLLSANIGAIDSPAPNKVVAPEWKEQKWATIAKVADSVVKVSEAYKNMKHTEMLAKLDNVQQQNLHALGDATDPCQLPELVKQANQSYDEMFKDDPYGKSFYESDMYKKFKTSNEFKVNQEVIKMNHKFDVIQATKTGNEISSDIALMSDTQRMSNALAKFQAILDELDITPDERFKIMSTTAKESFGKAFANNPNLALAWYNASNGAYDQYGVDGAEIKSKADTWNKAQRAEQRAIENYEHKKKTRERDARISYYQSQFLQDPSQKDTLLSQAMLEDDKIYVSLSEFIRTNTPKSSQRSELSKEFTKAYTEGKVEEFIEAHPEMINDPNTMSAYENYQKLNKEEDNTLEEMQQAFENGTYPEYRTNNLAKILSKSELRTADEAYRKELDISGNADNYSLRIANADTVEEVEEIAKEALNNDLLSDKEQLTIAKYKNTRISQLETKADKVQNKQEKATKEKIKDDSAKAYSEVLLEETVGSEAIANKIIEKAPLLTPEDRNKAIALYNRVAKAENKEQKDLSKELQEVKYNELMGKYRDGDLTQEDIDTAYENGDISIKHKEKLENTLYKSEIANAKEEKEKAKEEALKSIYFADANGETVNVSALPSSDSDVLKAANQVNLKNAKNKYYKTENEVFAEILANPTPNQEQIDTWKNKLVENDFMGNTKSPDEFITDSFNKIRNINEQEIKAAKNEIDVRFGNPLKGGKFTDYELQQKNLAYQDAITALADKKTPDYNAIVENRKPTLEKINKYYQTKDNAYFGQLGLMNNIFEKVTTTDTSGDNKIQSTTYRVKKGIKARDYIDYAQILKENRKLGYYTDTQYNELYKPIAINEGYILNILAEDKEETVEGAVATKLKELKGNTIGNASDFAKDFWECLAFVESEGKKRERSEGYNAWFNWTDDVGQLTQKWYKGKYEQAEGTISD